MAVKQNATLSSVKVNNTSHEDVAARAVDGNTSRDVPRGDCAVTGHEQQPSFTVTFDRPQVLTRITLLGATGVDLKDYTVEPYSSDNTLISVDPQVHNQSDKTYHVTVTSRTPVVSITVKGKASHLNDSSLTLCEIEAYGEPACDEEYHGLDCTRKCNCGLNDICNILNGLCATGCSTGFYGFACSQVCSASCDLSGCQNRYGSCFECDPGYTGSFCTDDCLPGFYGTNCSLDCAPECRTCHGETGECTSCKEHSKPPNCTDCADGYFGQDCSGVCPSHCSNGQCNNIGKCLSCTPGFAGQWCSRCFDGFYGQGCNISCPRGCQSQLCDYHGKCHACKLGYFGDYCETGLKTFVTDVLNTSAWYYLIPMMPILITIILIWQMLRKKPSRELVPLSEY